MKIFLNFCFHLGGVLGKRMLNPEVLKCHEDFITLETYMYKEKQWIINLTYVKTLTYSIIRLGPSWFTSTLYLIIYMSNIEAI